MKYRELKYYKYQLTESYAVDLPKSFGELNVETDYIILVNSRITIKEHYAWDGPSGPTFDTKNFMRGSLVHDCLYQLMQDGWIPRTLRIDADKVLRTFCLQDGMSKFRAWYVYRAVRSFGSAKPKVIKI